MASHSFPCNVIQRVLEFLGPQDIAFRTSPLNQTWYRTSLLHLYRIIPPFPSAFQLSRMCRTIITHSEDLGRSVVEVYIVHMQDADKIPTLYYTVRAALALCTKLETLCLHTDPSVMRIMLGECTFRLRNLSVIDCHADLPTMFLSRQEGLEELTILRGDTTPLYLPKDALPNLSSFSGIPENVIRVSRGRPLKTLRILPGPTPLNLSNMLLSLDPLVISSLNEFHVFVTGSVLHHVIVLSQFLPHLTALVLRYYQKNIPFAAFASTISTFVNLREYSMLSLNAQLPLRPAALESEHSIVTHYHMQCPTLRIVILRSVCWVRNEGDGQWSPDASRPDAFALWQNGCIPRNMDTKEAEDILRGLNEDSDEYSSEDYERGYPCYARGTSKQDL